MVVLEADVPVACHVVHADLAEASEIPHLVPVLEHVRERGGRADGETLSGELFLKLPLSNSMLKFCAENGLAERHDGDGCYAVTPDGEGAVESGRAFVSREGMWKVHYADHEMVPEEMRAVRIEDGSREAGYQPGLAPDKQTHAEDLPDYVRRIEGKTLRPSFGSRRGEAILRDVHREAKQVEPDLRLRLRVVPGASGSTVTLLSQQIGDGGRKAEPEKIDLPGVGMTYDEAIGLVIRDERGAAWDGKAGRLRVRYGDTSGEERTSMKRALQPRRIRVGRSEFDSSREVVDIFPASAEDARVWARDALAGMADEYMTREEYESLAARVRARFEGIEIELGARADHLKGGVHSSAKGSRERRLFWLIVSMEDWGL